MLHKDFREFLELLNKHNVKFLVVGGYAVAVHGYPRYTGNLDIFIAADSANAAATAMAIQAFGFSESEVDSQLFMNPKSIVEIGREPLKLHVMNSISGITFDECYSKRVVITEDCLDIPFIGYEELIQNKSSTTRGKDRVDVEELTRIRTRKI